MQWIQSFFGGRSKKAMTEQEELETTLRQSKDNLMQCLDDLAQANAGVEQCNDVSERVAELEEENAKEREKLLMECHDAQVSHDIPPERITAYVSQLQGECVKAATLLREKRERAEATAFRLRMKTVDLEAQACALREAVERIQRQLTKFPAAHVELHEIVASESPTRRRQQQAADERDTAAAVWGGGGDGNGYPAALPNMLGEEHYPQAIVGGGMPQGVQRVSPSY
jgi:hypothetical protein